MIFLHAADLHLGSAFSAFPPGAAAERRERQFAAFEALLADAQARGVGLVLLAGDCFDTPTPAPDLVRRFFGLLGALDCPVLVAPGNHDYLRPGAGWNAVPLPGNVTVFRTPELSRVDLPALGVTVYGAGYTAEHCPALVLPPPEAFPPGLSPILLAHADITSPLSPYAPLSPSALADSGFVYAALGHIHRTQSQRCGGTRAAYSGFLVGRGFDECGPGHARLVELVGGRVTENLLTLDTDRFEIRALDCTGAPDGETVRERAVGLAEILRDLPPTTALRLCLSGEVGVDCAPDRAALARIFARFALVEVRDETLPVYDADTLEHDPTLRGAFYRALLPRLTSGDPAERATAAEALRLGFAALAGREV